MMIRPELQDSIVRVVSSGVLDGITEDTPITEVATWIGEGARTCRISTEDAFNLMESALAFGIAVRVARTKKQWEVGMWLEEQMEKD